MEKCITNINNEEGIILVPSLDDSNNHGTSKYDDRDPKSNATSTMPPSSNTRPTDHRRRQRPGQGESGGAFPWWILTDGDDDAPKKNKKKQKQTSKENDYDAIGKAPAAPTPPPPHLPPPAAAVAVAATSSKIMTTMTRDCAMEFIRTIPIDIAFSTCLRFLVWGGNIPGKRPTTGIVTEEVETNIGPALLTMPSDFVPRCNHKAEMSTVDDDEEDSKLESSFENLRIIYEPLLIAMTSVYPGFAPALFVHLIDSILCLEHADENACHDKDQLDCRIHHLTQWVRYVLSRAFHMHFDRSVAMIAQNEAVAVQYLKQEHHQSRHDRNLLLSNKTYQQLQ